MLTREVDVRLGIHRGGRNARAQASAAPGNTSALAVGQNAGDRLRTPAIEEVQLIDGDYLGFATP
jgi:hypothetical protein